MKDDSLSDVNFKPASNKYYCARCDREIETIECPSCSSQEKLKIINIDKALETNVYERNIWNEAIEAAAKVASAYRADVPCAEQIRRLKK